MMSKVSTVLGRVDTAEVGRTLVHHHVLIGMPGWFMDARQPAYNRTQAVKRAVDAYFGRAATIIKQRERIKRQTIEHRRLQHRKLAA